MLGMVARMTVAQQQLLDLDLFGGATESIFPEVEAYLQADHDHQKAIQWVAQRKDASRYKSVLDFLFCETFPEWRSVCFRFYVGSGEQLRHVITMPQRLVFAWTLLQMIEHAYAAFSEQRWISWGHLREVATAAA